MENKTYRHWVNKENKPMTGRYYEFKSFKVYWSYRWICAEQLDKKGTLTEIIGGSGIGTPCYSNYSEKYKK